jgi:hypothetical protein
MIHARAGSLNPPIGSVDSSLGPDDHPEGPTPSALELTLYASSKTSPPKARNGPSGT